MPIEDLVPLARPRRRRAALTWKKTGRRADFLGRGRKPGGRTVSVVPVEIRVVRIQF